MCIVDLELSGVNHRIAYKVVFTRTNGDILTPYTNHEIPLDEWFTPPWLCGAPNSSGFHDEEHFGKISVFLNKKTAIKYASTMNDVYHTDSYKVYRVQVKHFKGVMKGRQIGESKKDAALVDEIKLLEEVYPNDSTKS